MKGITIHKNKSLVFTFFHETAEKFLENLGLKRLSENTKILFSFLGNGGYHIASKALSCAGNHRCLTSQTVRSATGMIRAETYFIAPINFRLSLLRLLTNGGTVFLRLKANSLWIFLKCLSNCFLRGEVPPGQIWT